MFLEVTLGTLTSKMEPIRWPGYRNKRLSACEMFLHRCEKCAGFILVVIKTFTYLLVIPNSYRTERHGMKYAFKHP